MGWALSHRPVKADRGCPILPWASPARARSLDPLAGQGSEAPGAPLMLRQVLVYILVFLHMPVH